MPKNSRTKYYYYKDGKRYIRSVFEYEDVKSFEQSVEMPPFWIEMAGSSKCDEKYHIIREESYVVVCEYIIKGSGTLHVDDKTYYPSAGDVYILPEYSRHEYYTDPNDPWVKIFFNVQGTAVTTMLQEFGLKDQVLFSNCEDLYPIFEAFYAKTKDRAVKHRSNIRCEN